MKNLETTDKSVNETSQVESTDDFTSENFPIDLEEKGIDLEILTPEERRRFKRDKGSDINPAEVELFLIKTFDVDFNQIRKLVRENKERLKEESHITNSKLS